MANTSDKPGKIGFYLFGGGEILFGLLVLLMALLGSVLPKMLPANPQFPMPDMWALFIPLFAFGSLIATLGVGTFLAKRWARKIMLILSWYGFSAGLLAVVFLSVFMGSFFNDSLSAAGKLTPAVITGIKVGMVAAVVIFYVILPGIFVLFYQSKKVLAAVEFYDPKENWMDACPTPVFAVSLLSAFGALAMGVFFTILGFNFPFFGLVFPVWGGALYGLVIVAALLYIAVGFYNLEMRVWWVALALVLIGSVSTYYSFKLMDPVILYQQMHYSNEQIDRMNKMGMFTMIQSMSSISWLMLTPYLAYLLFVRKYFLRKEKG